MERPLPLQRYLDSIPPFIYRLLAKTRDQGRFRALYVAEIAARSGLSVKTINHLSHATSFAGITVATVDRFIHGCGFNPFRHARLREHWKRIAGSKHGLAGVRHLQDRKGLSFVEKERRQARLRSLKSILEKI